MGAWPGGRCWRAAVLACAGLPALAQAQPAAPATPPAQQQVKGLSAVDLFSLAERLIADGAPEAAEPIFKALTADPDVEVRTEARFRLARLLAGSGRRREAATLYRAILDEKPGAARVRLDLAALLLAMGDDAGARRELRQAQAGGLPADVIRVVNQFQGALRAVQPLGGSFELALAPSSNINRATSATTVDTIIAPFDLSEDAQAQSGLGVRFGGQAYARLPVADGLRWTARLSGEGVVYGRRQFNDIALAGETGVEWIGGRSRLQPSLGLVRRWFGGRPFTTATTVNLNWLRRLGPRGQLDATIGFAATDFALNDAQDGENVDVTVALERAFSARSGGRIGALAQRQMARDPGFSSWSGGANLLYWHEAGKTTLFATASLTHLVADARLALFPARRNEWLLRAGLGATLRQASVRGFAPMVRLNVERNRSTVGIFDYRRLTFDIGLTRAF